jgi:hypothetical protein
VTKEPRLADGELSYSIEVLAGAVPAQTGPVTLFIDPLGRPLSRARFAWSGDASGFGCGAVLVRRPSSRDTPHWVCKTIDQGPA